MAEGLQAGTPENAPDVSENAGTPVTGQDGSEQADIKASPELVKTWKAAAEERNTLKKQVQTLSEQLREQQSRSVIPPTSGVDSDTQVLIEQAQMGNPLAKEALINRFERGLDEQVVAHNVPSEYVLKVKGIIRQSNYNTSVADAMRMARGGEVDTLSEQLQAQREEIERLKREVESSKTRVPGTSATVVPAAGATPDNEEVIAHTQYLQVLAQGGAAAVALRAKKDSGRLKIDFNA